jgi:Uma2 family endonuclease
VATTTKTEHVKAVATDRVALSVPPGGTGLFVTPEGFWDLCALNPSLRLTRKADGELIAMAPAGSESGARNFDLCGQLWAWNRQARLGVAFDSSTGFTLPDGLVHAPDASWLARDRWDSLSPEQKRKFAPVCPDFVAELMSPSDGRAETRKALEAFMTQGARLGWLIDPDRGEVEIHRPGRPFEILKRPATLSGEDVLPGFELDLKGILFD